MARLQNIENQLKKINETVFQELCDSYLMRTIKNHTGFIRIGSQIGMQKTIKGTPDSRFDLPNGNFIFVEITTNAKIKTKLIEDIKACFNPEKTKIPIEKIEKIIFCFNSKINRKTKNELNEIAKGYKADIKVRFLMLQELAMQLNLNHKDLVHEYLDLPLDTGQIVSIDNFIKEYDRATRGIAAPLKNTFLHREKELEQLSDAIDSHDFIILTGAPGVGKTKLAIETIKNYLGNKQSFQAYCVSYKSHTLLDDLYQHCGVNEDCLLFVDDANRINDDHFGQIIGFFKAIRRGKLKIIMTVRDYAVQEIDLKCQEFATECIELLKLTDEQIIDIIKSEPFGILNPDYHKKIVKISDGNPRLAIMTSLLAKERQDLAALQNVSDLFEKYFSTFIKDDGEFSKPLNIRCLGLISFFSAIEYKNKEVTEAILKNFDITYNDFSDVINKLDKLELVSIYFEHVKIPEQNLATYFFYKAFIKDGLLSFKTLLNNYFEKYQKRFVDSIVPATNMFYSQNVITKLKPDLVSYWQLIEDDNDKSFNFLKLFWFYLQEETLEFIYSYIDKLLLQKKGEDQYDTNYEENSFNDDKDIIIQLLGEFFRLNSDPLKESIELAFEYITKRPDKLPELIHQIRASFVFDRDDECSNFYRQKTLFDILIDGVNNENNLLSILFFELSKTFLSYEFHHTKADRSHSIIKFYQYPMPNNRDIQEFRSRIWDTLNIFFTSHHNRAFDLLNNYEKDHLAVNKEIKEIMEFDIPFIFKIINEHLSSDNFEHCKYVQDKIRLFKRWDYDLPEFSSLTKRFVNKTYHTFLKIDWDCWRDKEIYDFSDYREYAKLKEAEVRSSFIFNNINEINSFYDTFIFLKKAAKGAVKYNAVLDIIIDENCSRNFDIGCALLNKVLDQADEIGYIPRITFVNHLKSKNSTKRIWSILQQKKFKSKELWELSFFEYLDNSLITKEYAESLVQTITKMKNPTTIPFDQLERFLSVEPNLLQIILELVTKKNQKKNTKLKVPGDFFSEHFDKLGDDIEIIKKAYIQQYLMENHFDYGGKGFLEILKIDRDFLIEFVESLSAITGRYKFCRLHSDMSFVWNMKNIEETLIQVFDLIIQKADYNGILEHFCNVFFKSPIEEEKANNFIREYVKQNNNDYKKMQVIVDIIKHSRKELFEEIFSLFIALNQDVEIFEKLLWIDSIVLYSEDKNFGETKAQKWEKLLSIVNKSQLGSKLIPIKKFIRKQIVSCLAERDEERRSKFLNKGI